MSDKGRWYIFLNDGDTIPKVLTELVTEVSVREWVIGLSTREAGVYKHESAEAEVELGYPDEKVRNKYQIKVLAKNLNDALELVRRIKIGDIRPTESFEGAQGGKSRAELQEALFQIGLTCSQLQGEADRAQGVREAIWQFLRKMNRESKWPFCTKKRVSEEIKAILLPQGIDDPDSVDIP